MWPDGWFGEDFMGTTEDQWELWMKEQECPEGQGQGEGR